MPTAVVSVTALANGAEPSTNGSFRLSRDAASATPLGVFVQIGGTATPSQDYSVLTSQYTIPANQAYVDIPVSVNDDSSFESTETVTMTLQGSGNYTIGSPSNATVNIADNETPVVTVTTTANPVEGGTGQLQFTRASSNLSQSLTVNFSIGGTATSGSDFTSLGGSITFGANQNNASLTVTALADNLVEGDETILATVTSGTGYTIGTPSSTTLTITDDPPLVSVVPIADATEGGSNGTFRVIRTGGDQTASLAVSYAVGGTATSGTDFTALSGSVTIAANATYTDVSVAPTNDATADPNETVTLIVQDGGTSYSSADPVAASIHIIDGSTGIISGRAWIDDDSDGIQDSGEDGLSEVTAALFDGTTQIAQTRTDADGTYQFTGVAAGSNYHVQFTPLTEDSATFSAQDQGSDDTVDSDANASTGLTGAYSVSAGALVPHVDAGFNVSAVNPEAEISFGNGDNYYYLKLVMTTAGNNTYSFGPVLITTHSAKDARAIINNALTQLNWDVTELGDARLRINGYKVNNVVDPISSLTWTVYWVRVGNSIHVEHPPQIFTSSNNGTVSGSTPDELPPAPTTQSPKAVWISFSADSGYTLTVQIDTDGNQTATKSVSVTGSTRGDVRDSVYTSLTNQLGADWIIEKPADVDGALVIRGKAVNGNLDPVKKVTITLSGSAAGSVIPPVLSALGGATAERKYN